MFQRMSTPEGNQGTGLALQNHVIKGTLPSHLRQVRASETTAVTTHSFLFISRLLRYTSTMGLPVVSWVDSRNLIPGYRQTSYS